MADSPFTFIPQVDYTSRDYASIREDLIALIPTYAPQWTSRESSDFGITLVELFSYLGDLLNFYIDRSANEGFLATASQRDSILQIAAMLNYVPTASTPAIVELVFTNSSTAEAIIPASTQIATTTLVNGTSTQLIFETTAAVTVPPRVGIENGTAVATAAQGFTVANEVLGVSTGSPNQIFKLVENPVIKDSIRIFVSGVEYSFSPALIDNTIYDPVFTSTLDAEGNAFVIFGDGVGGRIPATSGSITATYRVGAGSAGNVPANKLTFFLTNAVAGVTVTNQEAAVGGADDESSDSIRTNAPLALRSLNRAVSLKDYAYLALQIPGVAKAIADSEVYTSINLYIAPFGDPGVAGELTTVAFDELQARTGQFFLDKTSPNVTLTVLPPIYVDVDLDITVNILPQYRRDVVLNQALSAVRELFSAENTFFADRVPLQYVLSALNNVAGVDYAVITYLRKSDDLVDSSISTWSRSTAGGLTTVNFVIAANPDIKVGQKILISGIDSDIDGIHTVVIKATDTSVTIIGAGPDIASGPAEPGAVIKVLETETIECATAEIPREGTFNISIVGGIS